MARWFRLIYTLLGLLGLSCRLWATVAGGGWWRRRRTITDQEREELRAQAGPPRSTVKQGSVLSQQMRPEAHALNPREEGIPLVGPAPRSQRRPISGGAAGLTRLSETPGIWKALSP